MRNRFLISFVIHFLLGILFVFPVFSAEGFYYERVSKITVSYFGGNDDNDPSVTIRRGVKASERKLQKKYISILERVDIPFFSFLSSKPNSLSKHLLKHTRETVAVSCLESLRSIVILC